MANTICEGILLPLITPFDQKSEVDEQVLRELTEFMVRSGVQGLFILGSAGQGPVMIADQRKRAAEVVMEQVRGRVPVVVHVGTADAETTTELALHAKKLGPAALAAVPPYYYSDHSEFEILEHFKAIAAAVDRVPLFLYDNPLYTGIHLTPEMTQRFVEALPSLCGIKVAFVGMDELLKYLELLPEGFGVFSGSIFNLVGAVPMGLKGAVHPPTSLFPELCVGLWKAIKDRRWEEAFEYQRKLYGIASAIGKLKGRGRSVLTALARLRGFSLQRYPRWKTQELSPEEVEFLRAAVTRAGVALKAA